MSRTIAIGDIHGCSNALATIIAAIAPTKHDTVVTLGDYVDRGPDSRGVIEQLLDLQHRCRLVALRGNHEQMMLDAYRNAKLMGLWHVNGGSTTLDSYGAETWEGIPASHMDFIRATQFYFETDEHLFVHANYDAEKSLEQQDPEVLLWGSLNDHIPGRHFSGKTAFVGHTIMYDTPFDMGHLVDLDTGCFAGSRLTAMDVHSRQIWQSNADGVLLIADNAPAPHPDGDENKTK